MLEDIILVRILNFENKLYLEIKIKNPSDQSVGVVHKYRVMISDQILIQLQDKHTVDFLQIQRLKKRKLILKDKIIDLRNQLEPDIIA